MSAIILQMLLGVTLGETAHVICSVCGRAFRGRNRHQNLETHHRIHTGETPFPCQFCEYRAKRKAHLQAHIIRIHHIDPGTTSKITLPNMHIT